MAMQFSLRSFNSNIPANSQMDFAVYGDRAFAVNVPDGCKIKFDNGEGVLFRTGIRYGVNGWFVSLFNRAIGALSSVPVIAVVASKLADVLGSNIFHKISIVNENSRAVDVEFLAGFGDVTDDSTIVENAVEVTTPPDTPLEVVPSNVFTNLIRGGTRDTKTSQVIKTSGDNTCLVVFQNNFDTTLTILLQNQNASPRVDCYYQVRSGETLSCIAQSGVTITVQAHSDDDSTGSYTYSIFEK